MEFCHIVIVSIEIICMHVLLTIDCLVLEKPKKNYVVDLKRLENKYFMCANVFYNYYVSI